jgi:alkanesulfonate monooxygenase SsuD/methylene tetrahydromethanopterin reductase-like flavin-dependent oxidoreductase (luciferase family)
MAPVVCLFRTQLLTRFTVHLFVEEEHMAQLHFGWLAPVVGVAKSHYVPIVMAQEAEILPVVATHFDSLWVYDHFYGFAEHSDSWLEGWTTLTWLAARFPTVQIGPLVLGVGYRNPALVAKMAATLQVLSGGRLVLGLGAGWREEEYRAYGYPFPKAADRIRQVEEAVQIMRRMWTEPAPTFKGESFVIEQAYCPPLPTPPPPIMIGGQGEQLMLPLIARQADWWNVHLWSMEEVASYVPTYQRKRDLVYRSPLLLERGLSFASSKASTRSPMRGAEEGLARETSPTDLSRPRPATGKPFGPLLPGAWSVFRRTRQASQ